MRKPWLPIYVRGLLSAAERKSFTLMTSHLAQQADVLLGGADAVLIVDDTAVKKQGTHSVGVAHQYCDEVGVQSHTRVYALDATILYPKRSTKLRTSAKYAAKQPRRIALVVPIVDGHSRTVNTSKKCP